MIGRHPSQPITLSKNYSRALSIIPSTPILKLLQNPLTPSEILLTLLSGVLDPKNLPDNWVWVCVKGRAALCYSGDGSIELTLQDSSVSVGFDERAFQVCYPGESSLELLRQRPVHLHPIGFLNLRHDELEPSFCVLVTDGGCSIRGRTG